MILTNWIHDNYIEVFGAATGIIYVFLEIRQNLWLWPVGIVTSAVYIWIFFTGKLYADMSLQGYYLIISLLGWYWWIKGSGHRAQGAGHKEKGEGQQRVDPPFEEPLLPVQEGQGDITIKDKELRVRHIKPENALILLLIFAFLFAVMWIVLNRFTDSPVPGWDSFITSLSIIATWMLARKIFEHWYLWMIVNGVAVVLFLSRGLYPTVVLYAVYFAMSFIGLREWRKTIPQNSPFEEPVPLEREG